MDAPIIYNLFPRLVGAMSRWGAHASRAREMGFNWIFLNPIQYPGFSGSLYAVKDFYRLNPLFVDAEDPFAQLRDTIDSFHELGLKVMMDLVVNHTAKDSELIKGHPGWFRLDEHGQVRSPSAIDPADARKVTVWGDLAEVDNANSSDRQGLWAYWTAMIQYYLDLGFDGFRCDAAYKVPRRLWEQLIGSARKLRPETLFCAETLGCRLAEVNQLKGAGFDYLFNSSKWWNFDATWCLDQHREFQQIAPSIAFPESHDTPRLMQESDGRTQVQRQRYAFAALFSAGVLMPIGYEFCFSKQVNVVDTLPAHWEQTTKDLTDFIRRVNRIKGTYPVLHQEGRWQAVTPLDAATLVLSKSAKGSSGVGVVINKDWDHSQPLTIPKLSKLSPEPTKIIRLFKSDSLVELPADGALQLDPAEVAILVHEPG